MSEKNINFNDRKIRKSTFYKNKYVYSIDDIDVNNISVSKKKSYGTKKFVKYLIGYNDNGIIRPLCVKLPQMTGYARKFDENATMSFIVKNKQILKKYIKIWETTEKLMKINFESKPVYGDDDKCLKKKMKIYADNIITNFHNKKMPKEKAPCKCISIILIDSVVKIEERKYIQEKIKIENYIDVVLEDSEFDSDFNNETESDNDNDDNDE